MAGSCISFRRHDRLIGLREQVVNKTHRFTRSSSGGHLLVLTCVLMAFLAGCAVDGSSVGAVQDNKSTPMIPVDEVRRQKGEKNQPAAAVSVSLPRATRQDMGFDDDPWGATNVQEQHWLDRHGYPNKEQHETFTGASDGILWSAANAGDIVAQVMLDTRALPEREALDRLLIKGAEGNLYALQSAASFFAGSTQGDVVTGYAIARVAEMRGDTSLALAREMMFRTPLTVEQRMRGEAEALKLSRTLDAIYREKTGSEFIPDPRPLPSE